MEKVLVSDCWTRKAMSIIRALGEKGIEVHTISHKKLSPGFYSKYSKKSFKISKNKSDEFRRKFLEILKNGGYECFIPTEDDTIRLLVGVRKKIEKYTKLLIPKNDKFELASDKWKMIKLAEKLKIPVPESFCPETEKELENIVKKIKFPIIIKPKSGSGSRGIKKVNNEKELRYYYKLIKDLHGIPIIQEYIPRQGQGLGVALLSDNGDVVVDFSYKRLREYPITGGPSTLRESTDNEKIKKYSKKLMKKLKFDGVAMVEFKLDPRDNIPKLMEINPRFWGSLELAKVSGINFPYLLYLQSKGKKIEKQKYKTGVRCRWLLPGDISHFLANPNRFRLNPSFLNFFDKNTHYDQLNMKDIKGSIATIICNFLSIFDLETWRLGIFRK